MDFDTILLVTGIIELITLICFFVLCSNVGELKRRLLNNGATCTSMFSMYMAMGDKENAKKALIKVILADTQVQNALNSTPDNLQNAMAKYSKQMKEVGLTFDANKAIVCKNMF
jgi:hypothetical protein